MGLFDFIFGKKESIDVNNNMTVSVTTTSKITEYSESKASKLAKEATQLKKDNKYEEALAKFLEALEVGGNEEFSVAVKLRLPMFYQLAGRGDDAWAEYHRMTEKYKSPYELARIYDKMRLQLQKEKSYLGAVPFGIYAYVMKVEGFQLFVDESEQMLVSMQGHEFSDPNVYKKAIKVNKQRVKDEISREIILKMLEPLLKKAKVTDKTTLLLKGIATIVKRIADHNTHCYYIEVHDLCKSILLES